MLAAGADVNTADTRWQFTPLARAAERGQARLARYLLDHGADPNATTAEHCALADAAGEGHAEVVAMLLAAGADVDATGGNGQTALMEAAGEHDYNRSIAMVAEMFAALPGPPSADQIVQAAQMQATEGYAGPGHLQAVRLLLASGADTGVRNQDGTALEISRNLSNREIAEVLESHRG